MDPNNLLQDKVAVVTGGGGGIGRAIALALASAGADVVIGDIVPERCDETVARIAELGRRGRLRSSPGSPPRSPPAC